MNFYPFHIGDYISHTSHLSDAEDLAYRRMIDLYYQNERPFEDVEFVARRIKSTAAIVQLLLDEFFVFDDNAWHNKRADEEIAKYQAKSDSARKANQMRWKSETDLKSDLKSDADRILTKNHEPVTKNQDKPIGEKRAKQLPVEFAPTEAHTKLANDLGINLTTELQQFKDHHQAKGNTMKDWDAALRTWIRNSARFTKGKPAGKAMLWNGIDKQDYSKGINDDGTF
jgi:uncharacterized protein YdaU (DUF1376 family)